MRAKVQHGETAGEASRPVFKIESAADCESARNRIAGLKDSTRDEDEEQELQALVEAVRHWDATHSAKAGGQRRTTP